MKSPIVTFFLATLSVTISMPTAAQSRLINHNFQVIERTWNAETQKHDYHYRTIHGTERSNQALNRLSILSENQFIYPVPESGCGPTALLNILIWYEKFGLISPFNRNADSQKYKLNFFNEIDRRISKMAGQQRTESFGTNSLDAAIVMDELVHELSQGNLRVHSHIIDPPYELKTFLEMLPNFRSGYLIVQPKYPQGMQPAIGTHAITFIRADRSGYLTFGTWGEVYRGTLKMRDGAQWFIPTDAEQLELKILGMVQFIPFEPTTPLDPEPQ